MPTLLGNPCNGVDSGEFFGIVTEKSSFVIVDRSFCQNSGEAEGHPRYNYLERIMRMVTGIDK